MPRSVSIKIMNSPENMKLLLLSAENNFSNERWNEISGDFCWVKQEILFIVWGAASTANLEKIEMNFQSFQLLMCVLMDVIFLMLLQRWQKGKMIIYDVFQLREK